MDTLIASDDTWALWAVLLGIAALGLWAERTSWGRRISGYAICILLAITLSNTGVIPFSAPAYDVVWDYFVPLAIPLLLFKADLRRHRADRPPPRQPRPGQAVAAGSACWGPGRSRGVDRMREMCPLDDDDRACLARKAGRAHKAMRTCLTMALVVPLLFVGFVLITPTELDAKTLGLCAVLVVVLDLPLLLKCRDLRRTLRRVDLWLRQGHKVCLGGEVTHKGPLFTVTVEGFGFAAWERSTQISVGDVVTVEYLPLDSGPAGVVGVLRVDGEPNPYFDSAWRSGPPTA